MTKQRVFMSGCLVLVAVVAMVLVRDCVDLFWQGPTTSKLVPPPTTARISLPETLSIQEARLGPDGQSVYILGTPPPQRQWWKGPDGQGWRRPPRAHRPRPLLYRRPSQEGELWSFPGTEGARQFAINPDGDHIAFVAPDSTRGGRDYVWITGGDQRESPVVVFPWSADWEHMPLWTDHDELIVVRRQGSELLTIPTTRGKEPKAIRVENEGLDRIRAVQLCSLIPGRDIALCNLFYADGPLERAGVGAVHLKTGRLTLLVEDGGNPTYVPEGRIVFAKQNQLFLARFDLAHRALVGKPVPLRCKLQTTEPTSHASFEIAHDGTLSQSVGDDRAWADRGIVRKRESRYTGSSHFRGAFEGSLAASPDGLLFATELVNAEGTREIWVYRELQPYQRRLIAVPGESVGAPVWAPDQKLVAYARLTPSNQGGIYVIATDGSTPPRQLASNDRERVLIPTSWAPDGSTILCTVRSKEGSSIAAVRADVGLQDPRPFPAVRGSSRDAHFSRDGGLVAFRADEPGLGGVYVSRWTGSSLVGPSSKVSDAGGRAPRWGPNNSLFYAMDGRIMRAQVAYGDEVGALPSIAAWDLSEIGVVDDLYDILPDGTGLFVLRGYRERRKGALTVIPRFVQQLPELVADRSLPW